MEATADHDQNSPLKSPTKTSSPGASKWLRKKRKQKSPSVERPFSPTSVPSAKPPSTNQEANGSTPVVEHQTESIADLIREYNSMDSPKPPSREEEAAASSSSPPRAWKKTASDTTREELEQYLLDLRQKQDFVVFPDNYEEVVTLMTEKDIQNNSEDRVDNNSSWSKTLLTRGIQKKETAHPEIIHTEKLKVARGIANIRKLDQVLLETENKLKKPTKRSDTNDNDGGTSIEEEKDFAIFITQKLGGSHSSASLAASEPTMLSARSMPGKRNSIPELRFNKHHHKSSASLTSRSSNSFAKNFIERNRETSATASEITATDEARIKSLLQQEPEENSAGVVYDSTNVSAIDEALHKFKVSRNAPELEKDNQITKGDAIVQEQREKREAMTRMSEINAALKSLKTFGRPGTAESRVSLVSTTTTVAPEDLSILLQSAANEVQEARASPADIEKLLMQITLEV